MKLPAALGSADVRGRRCPNGSARSDALLTLNGQIGCAVIALCLAAAGFAADSTTDARVELDSALAAQLAALAERCDALELPEQAAVTRRWLVPRDPHRQYLFVPRDSDPTRPADNAPNLARQWHARFLELRRVHAQALWELGVRSLEDADGSQAFQLIHEVLYHDPDHAEARRVLGFRGAVAGSPPPDRVRVQAGRSTHPSFGWRRGEYRYVDSRHFRITTSAAPKDGVQLAGRLEDLYVVWRQVYFPAWCSPELLRGAIDGKRALPVRSGRYEVVLLRDRAEYLAQLAQSEPQIDVTLGYYHKGRRTAFFYAGDESLVPTQFHEVTHQLFHESPNATPNPGEQANFWIVEGVAMYMESLTRHDGYYTTGGFDTDRLQLARARRLSGEFYMPLSELVRLGREPLQQHAELRRIYTQTAGLTHFLLDGGDAALRQATVQYAAQVHSERAAAAIQQLGSRPLEQLDAAYPEFLGVDDEQLQFISTERRLQDLCLTRTAVTDRGLEHLASAKLDRLEWLDLSFTSVGDAGLLRLEPAKALRQLNLEATRISDQALKTVAKFQQLEELDLSDTTVTDAGLAQLKSLTRLKKLWLASTAVTDASVPVLQQFPQLEFLDVQGAKLTSAALGQLCAHRTGLRIAATRE